MRPGLGVGGWSLEPLPVDEQSTALHNGSPKVNRRHSICSRISYQNLLLQHASLLTQLPPLLNSFAHVQVQSNALAALEAIDPAVAEEIMRHGCITGDRINGLVDGVSGAW
jgi:hypothetical protein